jgi:hypothetical protein
MTRVFSSSVALLAAWMFAGCHSGDGGGPPPVLLPPDSIVLEIDGKAFQAGCANGRAADGFSQGATCGSASTGAGPIFHSVNCNDDPWDQHAPIYFVGTAFRGLDPAGVDTDMTFDLSDPAHEQSVTVMMNYMDESRTEYHYCTAPPREADGGAYPPSSGIVTLHRFVPDPGSPQGDRISDAEITNAIVPSPDGGPAITIVAAHLYFQ